MSTKKREESIAEGFAIFGAIVACLLTAVILVSVAVTVINTWDYDSRRVESIESTANRAFDNARTVYAMEEDLKSRVGVLEKRLNALECKAPCQALTPLPSNLTVPYLSWDDTTFRLKVDK